MAAGMTSAAVRFWNAFAVMAVASVTFTLLLPAPSLAATPGARTSALTPLEQELLVTPDMRAESRQPVLGYLRHTNEGWKLDMLPGAVARTGPLPALTMNADSAPEYAPSVSASPYAPLLRIDF